MSTAQRYIDPISGRCSACHQRGSRCTCDGWQCRATSNGDRCQLRPHAGTRHEAKRGNHIWIAESPDARCSCCDGNDGQGIWHFTNTDHLRRFLADPDHEVVCEITVECVPGEPWAIDFVNATDAEAWLDAFDELERVENARERAMAGRR